MAVRTERDARLLGYAGLVPFAFAAVIAWSPGVPVGFLSSYLGWTLFYAAVIVSFMGGARWGVAMTAEGRRPDEPFSGFLAAVMPALVAWVAVVPEGLMPVSFSLSARFVVLMAAFAGLLAEDLRAARAGEGPGWYARLRVRLTFWVLVGLAFVVVRLLAG